MPPAPSRARGERKDMPSGRGLRVDEIEKWRRAVVDAAREIGGGSHVAGFGSLEIRTSIAWSLQIASRWGGEL